jgi:glutaminyl-peptide cyclotransferase
VFYLNKQKSAMKRTLGYILLLILAGCGDKKERKTEPETQVEKTIVVPQFNADSAYFFVESQVKFGPRVPNTAPHQKTATFLTEKLSGYGATVVTQEFSALTFDNKRVNLKNIIASYSPEKKKRILLAAHWDTRPFADKDPEKPGSAFDGANDGASGVGVLLEVARVLSTGPQPEVGIDIIFFDGEDWGEKYEGQSKNKLPDGFSDWWCLGSQYWARNKHKPGYSAYYGILLDMVGGKNALFAKEGYSIDYAPSIVDKVWKKASQLGFAHVFINQKTGGITDDHVFVNEVGKIPMVNIISFDPTTGFGDFHHTRKDNMSIISTETLGVVGQTLLNVIYYE